MEYNINKTYFSVGFGTHNYGNKHIDIDIDEPSEYVTQIEGSFGTSLHLPGDILVSTLTIHTNKKTHGPIGRSSMTGTETKFKSSFGRIVGFYGRCLHGLDQIGCFIAHGY
jgi:hypothetical protein